MNNFYVYAHINPVKNEIFYIGKGKGKRAYSKSRRNPYWENTVKKYGWIVDILEDNLTEEEAFNREIFYINKIGMNNLVNLTTGGEGASGNKQSQETIDKRRLKLLGQKRQTTFKHSDEHKLKMSERMKGEGNHFYGKTHNEESKKMMSEKLKGRKLTEEQRLKISASNTGRKHSEETKKKASEVKIGSKNPMYGKIPHNAKKVINTETNEIFNTTKEAALSIGISNVYLCEMLRGKRKNKTLFEYYN